jgi:hypothetical protein
MADWKTSGFWGKYVQSLCTEFLLIRFRRFLLKFVAQFSAMLTHVTLIKTINGIFHEYHKQFIEFNKQTTRKFNLQDCRFEFYALHYGMQLSFLLLNRISRK